MKKILVLTGILLFGFCTMQLHATEKNQPAKPSKFEIVFSAKAYWDGQTKSCLPREKGCCFHISFNAIILEGQMIGEMTYTATDGLVFTFNKRTGITPQTFKELFGSGKFVLDGTGTLSDEIIRMLRLPVNYTIPAGNYGFRTSGDMISITFK